MTTHRNGGQGMFLSRLALAAAAGAVAVSGAAAGQPINLLAPTPLAPTAPLPAPRSGMSLPMMPATTPSNYDSALPPLEAAQASLAGGRYATARDELEQAETRLLNDGAMPNGTTISAGGQALTQVRLARDAAIRHDRGTALTAVSMAIAAAQQPLQPQPEPVEAPPATLPPAVVPAPPPVPMITKALLPGRWQMGGWQYHWVPPETRLRTVETRPWVQGRYVWRDGAWTWVPSHYSDE